MCYLIFKQVDKLNSLLLCGTGLLLAASGVKIDALSDTVYEVSLFPHFDSRWIILTTVLPTCLRCFVFSSLEPPI